MSDSHGHRLRPSKNSLLSSRFTFLFLVEVSARKMTRFVILIGAPHLKVKLSIWKTIVGRGQLIFSLVLVEKAGPSAKKSTFESRSTPILSACMRPWRMRVARGKGEKKKKKGGVSGDAACNSAYHRSIEVYIHSQGLLLVFGWLVTPGRAGGKGNKRGDSLMTPFPLFGQASSWISRQRSLRDGWY